MKIAICDDNTEYIGILEDYFFKLDINANELDAFESGEDLIKMYTLSDSLYDIIFLDMEMSGINGIETANIIRKYDKHVIIVFVTSHTQYMQKSFECNPFRFLVKPLSFDDIKHVMDEAALKLSEERKTFVFSVNRNKIRLFCEDIILFENRSHWVYVRTKDEEYKIFCSVKQLFENIDNKIFSRVQRSYIVNLAYVKEISADRVTLYNYNDSISVGKKYYNSFIHDFMCFKERKYMI